MNEIKHICNCILANYLKKKWSSNEANDWLISKPISHYIFGRTIVHIFQCDETNLKYLSFSFVDWNYLWLHQWTSSKWRRTQRWWRWQNKYTCRGCIHIWAACLPTKFTKVNSMLTITFIIFLFTWLDKVIQTVLSYMNLAFQKPLHFEAQYNHSYKSQLQSLNDMGGSEFESNRISKCCTHNH